MARGRASSWRRRAPVAVACKSSRRISTSPSVRLWWRPHSRILRHATTRTDTEIHTTAPRRAGDYLTALRLSSSGPMAITRDAKRRGGIDDDDGELDPFMWDVNDMRQEVRRLRELKKALQTRAVYRTIATREAVFKVAHTYFSIFKNGFERGPYGHKHEGFLRSIMHRDVVMCSTMSGVYALAEQWRRYGDLFDLCAYKLQSVAAISMDSWPILQISCSFSIRVAIHAVVALPSCSERSVLRAEGRRASDTVRVARNIRVRPTRTDRAVRRRVRLHSRVRHAATRSSGARQADGRCSDPGDESHRRAGTTPSATAIAPGWSVHTGTCVQ